MTQFRVWGEYGPMAAQKEEYTVVALCKVRAKDRGIKLLKKSPYWPYIGEHNVYCEEIVPRVEEPEKIDMTDEEFLRDLAARLLKIPVVLGVDMGDHSRLHQVADRLKRARM